MNRYLYSVVDGILNTELSRFAIEYLQLSNTVIDDIETNQANNAEKRKFKMVDAWERAVDGTPKQKEKRLKELLHAFHRRVLVTTQSEDLPTSMNRNPSATSGSSSKNYTSSQSSAPPPLLNITGAGSVTLTNANLMAGKDNRGIISIGSSEKRSYEGNTGVTHQGPEAKRPRPEDNPASSRLVQLDPATSTQHETGGADHLDKVIFSTKKQYKKHCKKISKKAGKEYSMVVGEGEEKGYVLIINNKFGGETVREGSDEDVRSQKTLWKKIGCKVFPRLDLDATEMLDEIKLFTRGVEKVKICVVVIMTHGGIEEGKDILWGHSPTGDTDGGYMTVDKVLEQFSDSACPQLAGIPKLIIFQACRGLKVKGVTGADGLTLDDMFVAYATQPDHRAFRECVGSWFIKSITEVLNLNAHDTDVETMFEKVKEKVSRKIAYNPRDLEIHGGKQEVDYENKLGRKKLFLYPGWPKSSI